MSVQNPYNNYIKRQKQQPINNFKEKVKNSMSGKATQQVTGTTNTLNNKSVGTPASQQINTSLSRSVTTPQNVITTPPVQNSTPQATTMSVAQPTTVATNQPATPETAQVPINTSITPQQSTATTDTSSVDGLLSTSQINDAYSAVANEDAVTSDVSKARAVYDPMKEIVPGTGGMTREQYEAEVARKQQAGIKLDSDYVQKSASQIAYESLQAQQNQAQKDYDAQQKLLEEQKALAEAQNNKSKEDAEKAYKDALNTLYDNRYQQMEDLAVSGTNRGIQNSPQYLGLENVVNINTNKNIAKANEERMNLLSEIDLAYKQLISQINTGSTNALSDYQKALLQYQTQYNSQIMDWAYNDQQTQSDRDWQKEFLKYQLELEKQYADSASSSSKGYSSYSGGSGYSYTPYSNSYGSSYSSGNNGISTASSGSGYLSEESNSLAYEDAFKNISDSSLQTYSDMQTAPFNEKIRSEMYSDDMLEMLEYARANGMGAEGLRNISKDYDYAQNSLFERFGKNSKDTQLQEGNRRLEHALKTNQTPYYTTRSMMNNILEANKKIANGTYKSSVNSTNTNKSQSKSPKLNNNSSYNNKLQKTDTKLEQATKNTKTTKTTTTKTENKTVKKVKENIKKTSDKVKKSTTKAKENTKTSSKNFKTKNNKALSKSAENLKNNIKKLFKRN